MILTGPALSERFQALDDFLVSHQSLWRPKPFTCPVLPWEAEMGRLSRFITDAVRNYWEDLVARWDEARDEPFYHEFVRGLSSLDPDTPQDVCQSIRAAGAWLISSA